MNAKDGIRQAGGFLARFPAHGISLTYSLFKKYTRFVQRRRMLSPLEGKRVFDGGLRRVSFLVLLIGLVVFLGLSFHSHGDGRDHSGDCSVCAALPHSNVLPAVAITLAFCLVVLFSITYFIQSLQKSAEIYQQGSRAPPLFV
jgi:hypothetical protein